MTRQRYFPEGKYAIYIAVIKKMCTILMKGDRDDFSTLFLKNEWNLLAHAENGLDTSINHIELNCDPLMF